MGERIKGLSIGLDLDGAKVNKSLAEIRRSFRTLNSDLKLTGNNFKYTEKSTTSYKQRIKELDGTIGSYKKNVNALKQEYERVAKEQGENSTQAQKLRQEYNKQANELNYLERELESTTKAFDKFQKEQEEAQRLASSGWGKTAKTFEEMGPKLTKLGDGMQSIGKNMMLYVTAPVVAGFGAAAKKGIEFDDSMRKVQATSGATSKEVKQLTAKAREMGASTKFSASEAAEGMNFMALAGWDAKQMMDGLPGVMNLAAASGEELGLVTDILTDGLSAFGMKADQAGRFADVLAAASANSNTNVAMLGEAFKYVAPAAGALGYSIEDTSIALGLMANSGVKASMAGTSLKSMMTRLAKPTGEAESLIKQYGLSLTDASGKMLPFRDVIDNLRKKLGGLSEVQQAAAIKTIFGQEAMSGIMPIINASSQEYEKLTKAIDNSEGSSEKMAKTMEGGLGGSLRSLKSALEELGLSIFDTLRPMLEKLVGGIKAVVDFLNGMSSGMKTTIAIFGLVAAAIGPIIFALGAFISVVGNAMTVLAPFLIGIGKAGGLFAFLGPKLTPILAGFKALVPALGLLISPVGIIVAAIAGLGIAFTIAYKKSEIFRNIVHGAIDKVKEGFSNFVQFIQPFVNAIKNAFDSAINGIVDFAKGIGDQLVKFWQENGTMIMQALQNIGNFIKSAFEVILAILKPIMFAIWEVMKFIWPVIEMLIVSVWNNIKGVIQGALDFILGAIKFFSALFTGNWSQMWEAIKQMFSGALVFIWNLVQLWFVGKIFGVVKFFANGLKFVISGAWAIIKGIFTGSIKACFSVVQFNLNLTVNIFRVMFNFMKSIVNTGMTVIKNVISSLIRITFNIVKNILTSMKNFIQSIFTKTSTITSNIWNSIKNKIVSLVQSAKDLVIKRFNQLRDSITVIFNKVKDFAINTWSNIKNKVVDFATGLKDKVVSVFGKMRDGLSPIIDKIKDFIGGMVTAVKKGLNKLIDGINWVAGKLGMDSLPKIELHTGTTSTHTQRYITNGKLNQDTFATVGDKGKGNGPNGFRHEMIRYPNGKMELTPNKDTTRFLPKGTTVYNGAQTYAMLNNSVPRFSTGTLFGNVKKGLANAWDWTTDKVGQGAKWLEDKVGDVLDFVDNPGKLLDHILTGFGINFDSITKGAGLVGDMTKAAWSKIKKAATDWIREGLEAMAGGDLVGGILDPDAINYHYGHTAAYTAATGRPFHEGVDFPFIYQSVRTPMGGTLTRMPFMAGGYGNYVKITSGVIDMIFAHLKNFSQSPSSGSTVKPGDVVGLSGSTGFSTGPHLHFEMRRNGQHFDPEPWLRKAKSQGKLSLGGGKGGGKSWRSTVVQALKATGLPTSASYINAWERQIQTESRGNPRAIGGTDGYNDGRATGLVQVKPTTFNSMKNPGMGNIFNPLHNLVAGMNWAKYAYGGNMLGYIGQGRGYATGGKVWEGWYNLGEEGYPEYIIPTDPSRSNDAMKLLAIAANEIRNKKSGKNKRPSQLNSVNDFGDTDATLLLKMIDQLQQQNALLSQIVQSNQYIADKDFEPSIDKYEHKKQVFEAIDDYNRQKGRRGKFNPSLA